MLCAIYCRLSKEDAQKQGAESESIANQRAMLQGYAMAQGWLIYKEYIDSDYSGSDRTRPAFNQMLRDAKNHCFEIILCKSQSRFTREMELVEKYIHHDFLLWNIRFVAPADQIDTAMVGGKKARQINGLVNEWYLEDTSANIRAILDDKRKRGVFIGNTAPYGYCKQQDDKHTLTPDAVTANIVQQIFAAFLQGATLTDIAALLNHMGVESPAVYSARVAGKAEIKGVWSATAVSRILSNAVYTGNLVQGKRRKASYKDKQTQYVPQENWIVAEHTHEAIISTTDFEQVQRMRTKNSRKRAVSRENVLSGFVRCGLCGHAFTRRVSGKKQVYYYLCCPSCKKMRIEQYRLEAFVLQQLQQRCVDEIPFKLTKNDYLGNSDAKLKMQFAMLYNDRLNGRITTEQFEQANARLLHSQNALHALIQEKADQQEEKSGTSPLKSARVPPFSKQTGTENLQQKKQPMALTRRLLCNTLKSVTLYPVEQQTQATSNPQAISIPASGKKQNLYAVIQWL